MHIVVLPVNTSSRKG